MKEIFKVVLSIVMAVFIIAVSMGLNISKMNYLNQFYCFYHIFYHYIIICLVLDVYSKNIKYYLVLLKPQVNYLHICTPFP